MRVLAKAPFVAVAFACGMIAGLLGCASTDPEYLGHLESFAPHNSFPIALPTEGPFTKQIVQIAISGNVAIVVTEEHVRDKYAIFVSNDLVNWSFRQEVSSRPIITHSNNRVYWSENGFLASLGDSFEPVPQRQNLPFDRPVSGLASSGSFLLVTAQDNVIYKLSNNGQWSHYSDLPGTEELTSITSSANGFCSVASNSRKVWQIAGQGSSPLSTQTIASKFGSIMQLASNNQHTYLLTERGALIGDRNCQNWAEIPAVPGSGELYSIAAGMSDLYLTSQTGLYRFDGTRWNLVPTNITRAMVQRLRAIRGALYACHLGGLDTSSDFGGHWNSLNLPVAGNELVSDIAEHEGSLYAVTDEGIFHRSEANRIWTKEVLPAGGPFHLTDVVSNGRSLLVGGSGSPVPQAVIFLRSAGSSQWQSSVTGLEEIQNLGALLSIAGKILALTDHGVYIFDDDRKRWISEPIDGMHVPVSLGSKFGTKGLIVVTTEKDVWITEDVTVPVPTWHRGLDSSMIKPGFVVFDVWSNPRDEREIFLASNNQLLYGHEGQFVFGINPIPYSAAFSFASISDRGGEERLFAGTDFGVVFIDRRGAGGSDFTDIQKFYHDHSDNVLLWPITIVLGFLGTYALAVAATVCFLFLPLPPGFIGSDWLVSIIGKPLFISPRLGQWFLFAGYRNRQRRVLLKKTLTADLRSYVLTKLSLDGSAAEAVAGSSILEQVRNCFDSSNLVFLVDTVLPDFPPLLILAATTKGSAASGELHVLISPPYSEDDLTKIASRSLRNVYGVPVDTAGDTLRSQLENGNLWFYFQDVDSSDDTQKKLFECIRQLLNQKGSKNCRFIMFCKNIGTAITDPIVFLAKQEVHVPVSESKARISVV